MEKIAYFLEGVKQLTNIPRYHVKAVIDQNEVIEDSCIFSCIYQFQVCRRLYCRKLKEGCSADDGQFELLLIQVPNNPLDVQNIIAALIKHEVNETWMYFQKLTDIIEAREQIPWTLDGEDGGSTTLAHILNKNRAVTILV